MGVLAGQAPHPAWASGPEPLVVLDTGAPRLERGVFIRQVVALPNGNVLLDGGIDRVDDSPTNGLAMLDPYGRKAATLTPRCTQVPVIPGRYDCAASYFALRDGSFLLTAYVREPGRLPGWQITRYLANGSFDPQFRMPTAESSIPLGGVVGQSNDHVYVDFRDWAQTREIRRFALSLPIRFDPSYLASNVGEVAVVDGAGRLYDQVNDAAGNVVRRRNAVGAIDGAWRAELPKHFRLLGHDRQSDRIFAATASWSPVPREILRITVEGQTDTGWRLALVPGASESVLKELVAFQPGRILSVQTVDGADRLVVNSTLDGSVLASRPVPVGDSFVYGSGAADSWYVVNNASQNRSPIGSPLLRLHADLSIDLNFNPRLRRPGVALYATHAPSGGWLVAGEFSEVSGVPRPKVARLNADFSVDTAWVHANHPYVPRSLSWVGTGPTGTLATAEFESRAVAHYRMTVVLSNGQQWRQLRSIAPILGFRGDFGSILVDGRLYGGEFCAASVTQNFPSGIWRFPLVDDLVSSSNADVLTGCLREPGWGPVASATSDGPFAYGSGFLYYIEGYFSQMRVRRVRTDGDSGPDPGFLVSAQNSDGSAQEAISAMAVSGGHLYLTGQFNTLNGAGIAGLARVDLERGILDPGWPVTRAEPALSAIAVDTDAVYRMAAILDPPGHPISYEMTRYQIPSGQASAPLPIERSEVDLPAGWPWAPRLLALGDGRVLVTGNYWRIGGVERDGFAVVGTPDLLLRDGFEAVP
jgi:hypothetical protein